MPIQYPSIQPGGGQVPFRAEGVWSMAELLVFLLCGGAGLCAGIALALGAGWLLGIRLIEAGEAGGADREGGEPQTTLAAKVLMSVGGILGAAAAILLGVSAKAGGW